MVTIDSLHGRHFYHNLFYAFFPSPLHPTLPLDLLTKTDIVKSFRLTIGWPKMETCASICDDESLFLAQWFFIYLIRYIDLVKSLQSLLRKYCVEHMATEDKNLNCVQGTELVWGSQPSPNWVQYLFISREVDWFVKLNASTIHKHKTITNASTYNPPSRLISGWPPFAQQIRGAKFARYSSSGAICESRNHAMR